MSAKENNLPFYKQPKNILLFIWVILTGLVIYLMGLAENASPTIQNLVNLSFSGTNALLFYIFGKYALRNRNLHMNLVDQHYRRHYGYGMLIGLGLLLIFFIFGFLFQGYHYDGISTITLIELVLYFVAFLFQGFAEEILVRGIFQEVLSKRNIWLAMLAPSLLFSLMHLLNDNFNFYAMINTFLIGLIFALMTQITGSLWMAAGAHSMWNFLLGPVFGQYLSGIPMPGFLLKLTPEISAISINGGLYGPEASIVLTGILVLVTLYLIYYYRKTEVKLFNKAKE